jgi:hypothetical protein
MLRTCLLRRALVKLITERRASAAAKSAAHAKASSRDYGHTVIEELVSDDEDTLEVRLAPRLCVGLCA